MKFEMFGKDFKSLIDRISVFVPKKTYVYSMECVKISASGNTVTVQATDGDDFGTINVYADVYEDGQTWINLNDLKKITAINDMVLISATPNIFEVRSGKKTYQIPCREYDEGDYAVFPKVTNNNVMAVLKDKDLLNHLSKLNVMRSESENNMLLTVFCIDLPKRKIAALDGHRIGVANLVGGQFMDNRRQLLIRGTLYNKLKTIIKKSKNECRISFYADAKHIMLEGDDWKYVTKVVEGVYFDYEKLINDVKTNPEYTYTFDKAELLRIAKEYAKVAKGSNRPMILYNYNGNVATSIEVEGYRTSDVVETVNPEYGMEREFYCGLDAKYVVDACNMFDGEVTSKGKYSQVVPVLMMDDTYECLILPINTSEENAQFARKQVA